MVHYAGVCDDTGETKFGDQGEGVPIIHTVYMLTIEV